ncbi:MAG TPA: monovalent cation:proton antiporter-2 (CPA2) family protein [Xanthobacteraceae bacterium]|nr:monovalent cation:proton antiporter-2 (CPA2) family protein [Xanthobacteraceae bacterium]
MAADAHTGSQLVQVVALLAAGVIAVPIFKRIGLGSVLGYLAAGVVIGPFGLRLFSDPQAILHIAELGVVMFLFVIGLEMQPSRLWSLRKEIFGLGVAQVAFCSLLLTGIGMLWGLSPLVSFFAAAGFVLTSTATVMQLLDERREVSSPRGQRIVSILLLEDLAIVPLLVAVTLLTPGAAKLAPSEFWQAIGIAAGSVALLVAAGLWLLNPFFRFLAASQAREVMTAAALLVVLGAALGMQIGGLSMAMGAFLAGVLLSESSFRHQLEADIEPFRGILLGLFFLAVGMSIDLMLMAKQWPLILAGTLSFMVVKAIGIYAVARIRSKHGEGLYRAAMMAQGGEFAFVLYSAATQAGIFTTEINAMMTAAVIVSMALTPLLVFGLRFVMPKEKESMDGIDAAEDLSGSVLIIGFGRFGQIVSQPLLARGIDISLIDNQTQIIKDAGDFGFKVYYGDGTQLHTLHAAGAGRAQAILVCINDPAAATKIVELVKHEFPLVKVMVRAFDREHAIDLVRAGVDYQVREVLHSAVVFGRNALKELGVPDEEVDEVMEEVIRDDRERFEMQIVGGIYAGRQLIRGNLAAVTGKKAPEQEEGTTATAS